MPDLLVVFQGIHQTLSAEQTLQQLGVRADLVPTPTVVRTGCGFSLFVRASQEKDVPWWWGRLALPAVLYRVFTQEGRRRYEEIDRREGAGVSPAGDPVQEGDGGGRPG